MPQDNAAVVVYSTCPDEACARTIATRLVSAHLAACVNI
ncbi:MAG: divalent-cation tolerance protein CutA, partial [Alphaproteobacteria bacterium]|nr:divalent-cation tolerance protein CutA [Alphaproteobacteria bacterium]